MKTLIMSMVCVVSVLALSAFADAQDAPRSGEIYNPRYTDRLCPPEYPDSQLKMLQFMTASPGFGIHKLRKHFGDSAPASMEEIRLLNDADDAEVCEYFGLLLDKLINTQTRLFEGGKAEYWHDLTFYEGGDFYFIAISGGFLVQEHPDDPDKVRYGKHSGGGDGMSIFHKDSLEQVHLGFMD